MSLRNHISAAFNTDDHTLLQRLKMILDLHYTILEVADIVPQQLFVVARPSLFQVSARDIPAI